MSDLPDVVGEFMFLTMGAGSVGAGSVGAGSMGAGSIGFTAISRLSAGTAGGELLLPEPRGLGSVAAKGPVVEFVPRQPGFNSCRVAGADAMVVVLAAIPPFVLAVPPTAS